MSKSQRIVGWGAITLGVASIVIGASPIFPIFTEAFVIGGVFFAAGAWVLAGKELRASIRRAARVLLDSRRAPRGTKEGKSAPTALIDPLLPVQILKLAKAKSGLLTVAEVAMELNVPIDQAEAGLSECVRAGNAFPDYDIPRGLPYYRFPEFLSPEPPRIGTDG
jgi:hypothetical protein